jgi:hypothetical protein
MPMHFQTHNGRKIIFVQRLKLSGVHWTVWGANFIIALLLPTRWALGRVLRIPERRVDSPTQRFVARRHQDFRILS